MTRLTPRWHHFNNAEEVAHSTVHRILLKAQEAISHRGVFKLVLAGGTTPKRVYELLSDHQQEWSKWHLFISDERCLEITDPERNSLMIKQSLLDKINFPEENFHPINAQLGPEQGASEYAELISSYLPFDLTLLGIGEDGHTASLFPGHQHDETELTHAVYHSPKPPPERVSLSKKAISQSDDVIILVTGHNKKSAVQQWLQGESLPVAQIQAVRVVTVLIDHDARPVT
ncbi:MAG: 6-phosphogluconolactonase [gamma proteobacterium symbiont of Bathyaustriella thionipta]|nr:6-phosphogluconolactonase [gamma proteobacterium symbiont of Bathyaustriella thionipta]MCU7949466.1 6-phosphogluconolactonase [gamma proteobacterium symbiont of Bathyaustriella thionipta]MCU7953115.1 6-phosphogluconolactonase [gamma proteobacterium symbiont of Bathyaustriella thionipta]MCU7956053.1 6-phosphogluconolactonase [gamma proteobacterium symbiont of Bathyaustriella thionipta]MCU7966967.1 6-phosphogluconolactonase [gamma proteobacterium symbiont of Bathyaustriella thionipta]